MTYLYDSWYMAAWARDVEERPLPVRLLGEDLVLFRKASGGLAVLADRCPHKLAPLSLGRVEGDDLRCMYHGVRFGADGRCVEVPGQSATPAALCVRSYPVVELHSAAWIWMGASERADISLIPPFRGIDDPAWRMLPGCMDYDVNYELINENLLDLSHVAFVHRDSFGGGEQRAADPKTNLSFARRTTEMLPRGLRITRVVERAPVNPILREAIGPIGDIWSVVEFLAPGVFLMSSDVFRAGAVAAAGGTRPADDCLLHRTFTCQAVAPVAERSSRYHFAFGPWAPSPIPAQRFADVAVKAFEEDKVMITAQQRVIDRSSDPRPILLGIDRQGVEFARIMKRLIGEQNAANSSHLQLKNSPLQAEYTV